jgi:hypothetical protein
MTRRTTASLDLCERSRGKEPTITATPAVAAEAALGNAGRHGPIFIHNGDHPGFVAEHE